MANEHLSSKVIDMARGFGIPTTPGQDDPFTDEAFLGFCQEYRQWASVRDEALKRHLQATATLFRVFLPYTRRVFAVTHQIAWYLDEVIVRDPLERWVNDDNRQISARKEAIRDLLQLLSHFRALLDAGYLLLAGPSLLQNPLAPAEESLGAALQNPRLQAAFDEAARYSLDERTDEQGNVLTRCLVELDSGGVFAFRGTLPAGRTEMWRMGESFPEVSRDRVLPLLQEDWRDLLYPRELARILNSVETARSMRAAILFDRQLPATVIDELGQAVPDNAKQLAAVCSFNVSLPYIDGVSPERLMEARESIPDAFRIFRGKMYQIVKESLEGEKNLSQEELLAEVERAVLPQTHELESELKALALRRKLLGIGPPVISGIGVLAGHILGAPLTALISLALVGPGVALQQVVDTTTKQIRQEAHPFYFLWKVNKG